MDIGIQRGAMEYIGGEGYMGFDIHYRKIPFALNIPLAKPTVGQN